MSFYFGTYDFRFHISKTNNNLIGNTTGSNNSTAGQGGNTQGQGSGTQTPGGSGSTENPQGGQQGSGATNQATPQEITIEKVEGGYDVKVDGQSKGVINIPNDKYLKAVTLEEDTKSLKFVLDMGGNEQEVLVPLTLLSDEYQKGNGLELNDKTFSIKLSSDSEPYLTVTEDGLSLAGLDAKLNEKLTKAQADTLYAPISSVSQGGGVSEEDMNTAIGNAKTELQNTIATKADASAVKTYTAGTGLQLNDTEFSVSEELQGVPAKVTTLEGKVTALEGGNFATKTELGEAKTEVLESVENDYIKKSDEKTFVLESDGLVHTLKFGGQTVGTINIPKDLFATNLEYDADSKSLKITVNNSDGDAERVVSVDVSEFVNTYEAGDGLKLEGNVFSLTEEYVGLKDRVESLETKNTEQDTEISNIKRDYLTKAEAGMTYITSDEANDKFLLASDAQNVSAGTGLTMSGSVIGLSTDTVNSLASIEDKADSTYVENTYQKKSEMPVYTASNGVEKNGNNFQLESDYVDLPSRVDTLETEKISESVADSKYATKTSVEDLVRRVGVLETNYTTLQEKYTELTNKYNAVKQIADQNKTDIEELKERQPMETVPVGGWE